MTNILNTNDLIRLERLAEQGWAICVNQQKGVSSHAYTPGPLSTFKEYNLDRFLRWYFQEMKAHIYQ